MIDLKSHLALIILIFTFNLNAQEEKDYKRSLVNFEDYELIINQVKKVRSDKLINFDQLLEFQKHPHTIILDTRSKDKYEAKHLAGAINLPFTEFTTERLRGLIPKTNTRIIIYCNNNFAGDQKYFASKFFTPEMQGKKTMIKGGSMFSPNSITLALNIPTYLALYGYGYRNIYELNELVNIDDPRVELEGHNGITRLNLLHKK